jgi:peptidoglycan/LPS O-acetylase OafA/YrhL
VLCVHCNFSFRTPWLETVRGWGWAGVDLFFVISGFLITSILLKSKHEPHYYRNFYARRGLRIWPLYFLLLVFIYGLTPHLGKWARQDVDLRLYPWPLYALYIQNLVLERLGSFPLVITWSLCVEEQFYLVWPLVVKRMSRRGMEILLLGVMAGEPLLRWWMKAHGHGDYGFFTLVRLDAIAAGALIALRPSWLKHGWVALPVAIWLLYRGEWIAVYSALAIGFASIVTFAVMRPNRVLGCAPLRFIGKISYGIYITHPIMFGVFWGTPLYLATRQFPHANLIHIVGQILMPLPVAILTWYLFEQPILRLKRHFEAGAATQRAATKTGTADLVLAAETGD